MPFNETKKLTVGDFLKAVQKRLAESHPEALSFFEIYLAQAFMDDLVTEVGMIPGDTDTPMLAEGFDVIYTLATMKLRQAAGRNHSEVHSDSYKVADTIAQEICAELNEYFECSGEDGEFDPVRIESLADMLKRQKSKPETGGS